MGDYLLESLFIAIQMGGVLRIGNNGSECFHEIFLRRKGN
jgi:hypothetical protein